MTAQKNVLPLLRPARPTKRIACSVIQSMLLFTPLRASHGLTPDSGVESFLAYFHASLFRPAVS